MFVAGGLAYEAYEFCCRQVDMGMWRRLGVVEAMKAMVSDVDKEQASSLWRRLGETSATWVVMHTSRRSRTPLSPW